MSWIRILRSLVIPRMASTCPWGRALLESRAVQWIDLTIVLGKLPKFDNSGSGLWRNKWDADERRPGVVARRAKVDGAFLEAVLWAGARQARVRETVKAAGEVSEMPG